MSASRARTDAGCVAMTLSSAFRTCAGEPPVTASNSADASSAGSFLGSLVEDRLVAPASRFGVAFAHVEHREIVRGRRVVRLDLERAFEALPCALEVALREVDDAAQAGRQRALRLLLLQCIDRGERLVVLAPAQMLAEQCKLGLRAGGFACRRATRGR